MKKANMLFIATAFPFVYPIRMLYILWLSIYWVDFHVARMSTVVIRDMHTPRSGVFTVLADGCHSTLLVYELLSYPATISHKSAPAPYGAVFVPILDFGLGQPACFLVPATGVVLFVDGKWEPQKLLYSLEVPVSWERLVELHPSRLSCP
jgi:hypothetical protein